MPNLILKTLSSLGVKVESILVVVSLRANTIKNVATVKEMYQVADFYYELERKLHD